jgi:hypothetical protein
MTDETKTGTDTLEADSVQPGGSDQPVGQITVRVSAEKWKKFEYFSLRNRVQRELVETQKISPGAGSPIEADNKFLAPFHSSFQALVTHRLFSVFDHLQLAAWTLEQLPRPLIFSQFSLVRAALAGASTAHWIVSGDSTLRRMRALRLAFYDLEQETTFAKVHVTNPYMQKPENAKALGQCQTFLQNSPSRQNAIYQEYCKLLRATGKTKMPKIDGFGTINETGIVQEISNTLQQLGKMSTNIEVELQYRLMSGFVHNCLWASQTGATTETTVKGDVATVGFSGNADNIYNGTVTAFEIAKLAKARLEQLCEAGTPSQ